MSKKKNPFQVISHQSCNLLNKEGSNKLTSHITNITKYKKKLTITNITNILTDQVVIEFAVSQMRLQLTKSVIFAGVCCFVSQLSTFRSEHYLLFSCKEKVNIRGKRKIPYYIKLPMFIYLFIYLSQKPTPPTVLNVENSKLACRMVIRFRSW